MFIDLLGTCHTETVKPAVLQAKHLRRFQLHEDRGLSFIPPEVSDYMLIDDKGNMCYNKWSYLVYTALNILLSKHNVKGK